MQWNEGFEWAPFGLLWIKSLHCLWMTTMDLWSTTDAGYADTETSRNMSQSQSAVLKEYKEQFLWMLHFSTGSNSLNTTTYRRITGLSSGVPTAWLSVGLPAKLHFKLKEVHSWGCYCVFTENFNKTSLIHFCFHSKCWHF